MELRALTRREIVAISVLAALLLFRAFGPDVTALQRAKGFPTGVVVSAQAPVNIYRDQPQLRTLQLLDSINAMWTQVFAASGSSYDPPLVKTNSGRPTEGCGSENENWAGIYCTWGNVIVIDLDDATRLLRFGDTVADDRLAYVLAHEIGHHVQHLRREGGDPRAREDRVKAELQAECYAGLYGRASGRALPPDWMHGEDGEHGTAAEQHAWLKRGYDSGRPAECQAIWD